MRQCLLAGDQAGLSITPLSEGSLPAPIWSLDLQEDVTCCWSANYEGIFAATTRGLLLVGTPCRQNLVAHKSARIPNASFTDVASWGHDVLISGSLGVSVYSAGLQCIQEMWTHRPCLQIASLYDKQLVAANVDSNILLRKMDGTEEIVAEDARSRALQFSPILPIVGYGQSNGQVAVWDCGSSKQLYNKTLFSTSTTSMCFSCHSDKLLVVSCMEKVAFVDFRDSSTIKDMVGPQAGITAIDYARDGYTIACGCRDGSLQSIDLRQYTVAIPKEIRVRNESNQRVNRVIVGDFARCFALQTGSRPAMMVPAPYTPQDPTKSKPSVATPSTAQLSTLMSRVSNNKLLQRQHGCSATTITGTVEAKAEPIASKPTTPPSIVADDADNSTRAIHQAPTAVDAAVSNGHDARFSSANALKSTDASNGCSAEVPPGKGLQDAPRYAPKRREDDSKFEEARVPLEPQRLSGTKHRPVPHVVESSAQGPRAPSYTSMMDRASTVTKRTTNGLHPVPEPEPSKAPSTDDIVRAVRVAVEAATTDIRKDIQSLGFEMITQFHAQKVEMEDLIKELRQEIQDLRAENADLRKMQYFRD